MTHSTRNIIIVGGGIVGTVQALLLARAGCRVTLVDASNPSPPAAGINVRSVALSYRSRELLLHSGLWPENSGCPINEVHVTERGKFGSVRLQARDLDIPQLGSVIQNAVLEQHLLSLANHCPAIELHQPASAQVLDNSREGVSIEIQSANGKQQVDADLLIAADGTSSKIREGINIKTSTFDYRQHAVVANLKCQRDHKNIAYERFTHSGPLALLPLDRNLVAMVYTVDSPDIDKFKSCSDKELLARIQKNFGGKLGRFEAVGQRGIFPLERVESHKQVSRRVVFIGNAARTVHPVAGQGLNLALRDVFELSALIGGAADLTEVLDQFVRARTGDQRSVVRQTDLLARVFRHHPWPVALPLSLARSTALMILDLLPPLRKRFGAASSGLRKPVTNPGSSQHPDKSAV